MAQGGGNLDANKLEIVVTVDHQTTVKDFLDVPSFTENCNKNCNETIVCPYPGVYSCPENENEYFICQKKAGDSAMEKIHLNCPKDMMFDSVIKQCRKKETNIDEHHIYLLYI